LTNFKIYDIIFIENKKGNKIMEIIKILFATIMTFEFFYNLLEEGKKWKMALGAISYILFIIIVAGRNFF
jgi:hypothetical protein